MAPMRCCALPIRSRRASSSRAPASRCRLPPSVSTAADPDAADRHVVADGFSARALGTLVRHTIVGGRAVAAMSRAAHDEGDIDATPEWRTDDSEAIGATRAFAERAAHVLGLELAGVDVVVTRQGPIVVGVTVAPALSIAERVTEAAICEAIVVYIEQTVRQRVK